jgi:hypothetical protein
VQGAFGTAGGGQLQSLTGFPLADTILEIALHLSEGARYGNRETASETGGQGVGEQEDAASAEKGRCVRLGADAEAPTEEEMTYALIRLIRRTFVFGMQSVQRSPCVSMQRSKAIVMLFLSSQTRTPALSFSRTPVASSAVHVWPVVIEESNQRTYASVTARVFAFLLMS